jgi:hypothetical protein
MSSGTVLLFSDEKVSLLPFPKKVKVPVTSLDVTLNGEFVFVGHANGSLVLWDSVKNSILKEIDKEFDTPIWGLNLLSNERAIVSTKVPKAFI